MPYLLGRITGAILFSLILGSIIIFIYSKVANKPFLWKKVIIAAIIIYLLATLGRITDF